MRNKTQWLAAAGILAVTGIVVLVLDLIAMPRNNGLRAGMPWVEMQAGPAPEGEGEGPQTATFGNGCFWCTEAVFQQLKGVKTVVSGYSGGMVKNPTYEQVCTGTTGHAEVIQITYDPKVISFVDLLEVFWKTHDPTTPDRQGNDKGPQYRSAVFYHTPEQKKLAEEYKQKLDDAKIFDAPIVTEVTAFKEFYPAEKYHQNYYINNPTQGYCVAIIGPKLEKFQKVFKDKLKTADGK